MDFTTLIEQSVTSIVIFAAAYSAKSCLKTLRRLAELSSDPTSVNPNKSELIDIAESITASPDSISRYSARLKTLTIFEKFFILDAVRNRLAARIVAPKKIEAMFRLTGEAAGMMHREISRSINNPMPRSLDPGTYVNAMIWFVSHQVEKMKAATTQLFAYANNIAEYCLPITDQNGLPRLEPSSIEK